jgi:hypothetical protein
MRDWHRGIDVLERDVYSSLAGLTHGQVFDGRAGSLTSAFCAIRGYQ